MPPLYRYSFANIPPVRRIVPGETLQVEFPDSDGLGPDLTPLPEELFEQGTTQRGNPVYGPIAVDGALPGDVLRIQLLDIAPNRTTARTLLAPDHGFLPDALWKDLVPDLPEKPRHMYLWKLHDGRARLDNPLGGKPVSIPIQPFLGCAATATEDSPLSTLLAGAHGGNLDHPDLRGGTTLWLPVSVPGGLLYVGDMHAAQGHGETAGGGLEISGSATFRVDLCKGQALRTPRYQTPEGIACLAVGKVFEDAARAALAEMTCWLSEKGWNIYDAGMLAAQTCEFRAGGLTGHYAVVSCFVAKDKAGLSEE